MLEFPLRHPNPLADLDFDAAAARLRTETGAILMGVATIDADRSAADPAFRVTLIPPAGTRLAPEAFVVVLASAEIRGKVERFLGVPSGRPPRSLSA